MRHQAHETITKKLRPKSTENIQLFEEFPGRSMERRNRELVALIRSKYTNTHFAQNLLNTLQRWLRIHKQSINVDEDITILAGAFIERHEDIMDVTNLASQMGYGPTLFAALIQMAKEEGLSGVIFSTKVSREAIPMLKNFTTAYDGDLLILPTDKVNHSEPWLNCSLSLVGKPFMNLSAMRTRYSKYLQLHPLAHGTIREAVFDTVRLSVDAHTQGTNPQ